jgi:hypothetical protein
MLDFFNPATLTLVQLLVVSITIEAIAENILWLIKGEWCKERLLPFVVALVIANLAQVDLFHYAGISLAVPIIAYSLSGIMMARGANVIHAIAKTLGDKLPGQAK